MRLSLVPTILAAATISIIVMLSNLVIKNNSFVDFAISSIENSTTELKVTLYKMKKDQQEASKYLQIKSQINKVQKKKNKIKTIENANVGNFSFNMDLDILKQLHTLSFIKLDSVVKYNTTYKLLVLVTSHPRNYWRREWIRSLWGNKSVWKEKKWRIVFVTGQEPDDKVMRKLNREAKRFKDILCVDITEDFYLLSHKLIVGLTWSLHNLNFKFLLKVDDDVFVNINNAIRFVDNTTTTDGYYGSVIFNNLVERIGKYAVSEKEHLSEIYSPYCSGGGYILTRKSIVDIIPYFDIKRPLKIDDAYIGETAMRAGISATQANGFYMSNTWCEYKKDIIVSHPANDFKCLKLLTNQSAESKF
ncbi:UDP-GalNAc:beta-1,3-N-acetylgalactosaminyltransferase 1 isoform X2 [Hydra vulgaris]|uniref:UDP-GalNAc:beta-1, 3-N-acetylgalactosaminyltransferase 1 isoform X2 n=1 Tax=Hydra vulgaris TaxID=6087 RepID=UPI001F5FBE38|nr:UDP-GalNAc:beta-1,3-N-acetylgalactosaminyltransferase 1 isoform X2 [Hydra vulgaris]